MRETECFSMYSDMSSRIMDFSSSNKNSASARASSVFPTPVGPRKIKDPIGRLGSESPARFRRMEFATRSSAESCPMTRLSSGDSLFGRREFAVADFRHLRQVSAPFQAQLLGLKLFDLFLDAANFGDGAL